jgi:hypothetical protein
MSCWVNNLMIDRLFQVWELQCTYMASFFFAQCNYVYFQYTESTLLPLFTLVITTLIRFYIGKHVLPPFENVRCFIVFLK